MLKEDLMKLNRGELLNLLHLELDKGREEAKLYSMGLSPKQVESYNESVSRINAYKRKWGIK